MLKSSQLPRPEQLLLLQPRPNRPAWKTLPAKVREQTVELLTRMLSEHWMRTTRTLLDKETTDE
jgi:hypothetical protein